MSAGNENEFQYVKSKAEAIRAVMKTKPEFDLDYLIIQLTEVYNKAYGDCKKTQEELEKYK